MDDLSPLGLSTSLNGTIPAPLVALAAEVDPETCQLLGPVALGVQGLMGLIVIGSLVLKRAQEKPKRKWRVWTGDVGKQVVGQAFVHASNVLISDLIARHKADNPCSLYALNIAIDTTLGVLVLFGFLKLSTHLLLHYQPTYRTGDYGNPFSSAIWAKQAAVYVACLSAMKVVVLLLFWAFPALFKFANWCLSWLPSDDAQVVFVMLIFPLVMNLFQFLTIDSILKSKPSPSSSSSSGAFVDTPNPDDEARRGFLEPSSDELEDEFDEEEEVGRGPGEEGRGGGDETPRPLSRQQGRAHAHAYPPAAVASSSSPPFTEKRRRPAGSSEKEEEEEEEEGEDDWGVDWGASMTSLDLEREVEQLVGSTAGGGVGEKEGFGAAERRERGVKLD